MINTPEAAGTGTAEWLRLEALGNLHLLDTPAEERFDRTLASVDQIAGMVRASVGPRGVIRNVSELMRLGDSGDDVTVIAIQRAGP